MQKIRGHFWVAILVLTFPSVVAAQGPIRWHPTLESAKREAARTNRLVLVHFWADWCQACKRMQREVFTQPQVAAAVQANYVAVKINADYFPATSKEYGVTALPTDVIITPQGQQIEKLQGLTPAVTYVARLSQVAANVRTPAGNSYTQNSSRPPQPVAQASRQPTGMAQNPNMPTKGPYGGYGPPAQTPPRPPVAPPQYAQPQAALASNPSPPPPPVPAAAGSQTPLGLDGYCPVQLLDDMKARQPRWTPGNRQWGAVHRSRTYLFAGADQQRRFLADPDRYAPVLSGGDVVFAVEQGQTVEGRREHGITFGDRIYLFASEATLQRFEQNPNHYANQAMQPQRTGMHQGPPMR